VSTEDWNAVGAVGQCAAAAVTLAVLIYAITQDYWKLPKLELSFDNGRDVKSQILTVGLPANLPSRWLRVRVRNANRRRAAKNCRAYLIGIEQLLPNGTAKEVMPNDVRQMQWMHDPPNVWSSRDLLPGVNHWADLLAGAAAARHGGPPVRR
jgi:hypothetical protein